MEIDEYKCAVCGNIYKMNLSENYLKEAQKEYEENFGVEIANAPDDSCVLVCDDCYEKIAPPKHPLEVHMTQQEFFKDRN